MSSHSTAEFPSSECSAGRTSRRAVRRVATVVTVAGAVAFVGATPAFAHVTPQPDTATQGSETVIAFRVPDESDVADTIALSVTMPTDHPITSVSTTPVPGWNATTRTVPLNPPVQADGETLTEAVGSVTWTAAPGNRIAPGQYLEFPLLIEFPTGVSEVILPTSQTYDNGEVVDWNQPPNTDGSEPERPAPRITLTAAGPTVHDQSAAPGSENGPRAGQTDATARWLGGAGLLLGALGLGVGVGAVLHARRAAKRN
ncbi:YcnI family protein [Pseudonocardia sp. CA-142604]|uniref:YcnI family copper-binding membrane protein n=1 Tax=Pseudonocardia sp. CA-142604 TaxID=3240024 RepID=UPI003D906CD9